MWPYLFRQFPTIKSSKSSGNPAVYCGTYHKYNCGSIEGMWIDLTSFDDYDEFIEFCRDIHCDEDDPEFMFQDYENFPKCWYSESCFSEDTFDKIIEYANHPNREALEVFFDCFGHDYDITRFDDAYMGEFDSEEDFAEYLIDECYDIERRMGNLSYNFDYSKFARDLFMCDYYFDNGYVFNRNF